MSLDAIAFWNLVATVPGGVGLFLLLHGRRRRRLAAEKKRRALAALAKEERRLALEWRRRDRERARAAESARQSAPVSAALRAGQLDGARKALASVREPAAERPSTQELQAVLEAEGVPWVAASVPTAVYMPSPPREAPAVPAAAATAPAAAPPAASEHADREGHQVRFQALWHESTRPEEWQPLFTYMYCGRRGFSGARADFRRRIEGRVDQRSGSAATLVQGPGVPVTVIPELPGFVFDPPAAKILWLDQWECVGFRMQAGESYKALDRTRPVQGRVVFLVGPLLIAETAISIRVLADNGEAESIVQPGRECSDLRALWREKSSPAYEAIFLSYSHEDSVVVRELENVRRALADSYLRDVRVLRNGEARDSSFLSRIRKADVFQLCWSHAARLSPHVEREWRCALRLERRGYIRPIYFEKPMPDPPNELRHMHFTFVDISS